MSIPSRTSGLRLGNSKNLAWMIWLAEVIVPVSFPPRSTVVSSAMTALSPLSATPHPSRRHHWAFFLSRYDKMDPASTSADYSF